jgi:Tfp pilus assembly protein PilV
VHVFARNPQLATRNSSPNSARNAQLATRNFLPAFTFIEVLFAVILLGIGFIMIAGVFPVAIQQTAAVSDETQGTAIARDAIKKIQAVADSLNANVLFPTTGTSAVPQVWAITTTTPNVSMLTPANNTGLMAALGADSFFSADHRYGWVGFYRRDSTTAAGGPPVGPFAQVYVITLQNPNFASYLYPVPSASQTTISGPIPPPVPPSTYGISPMSPPSATSTPPSIQASFYYNSDGSTTAQLTYPSTQTPNGVTGAYVLVAALGSGGSPAVPPGMIGRFFRLGVATGSNTFLIQPGFDITPSDATTYGFTANGSVAFTASVWLIGAAPMPDPGGSGEFTGPFSGPNQDIGVATGFIRVNTANN